MKLCSFFVAAAFASQDVKLSEELSAEDANSFLNGRISRVRRAEVTVKKCNPTEFMNMVRENCRKFNDWWNWEHNGGSCTLQEEFSESSRNVHEAGGSCDVYEECCGEGCVLWRELGPEECY